jgi:hypothetical protein
MIPIVMASDKEALAAALRANWGTPEEQARIVRIPNTLQLEYLYVSEALLPEIVSLPNVEVIGQAEEMNFDGEGYFAKSDFAHGPA